MSNLINQLTKAVAANNIQKVIFLLERGVNPNGYLLPEKITPLHVAVTFRKIDIAKILLQAGADPLAVDCEGDSVLAYSKMCWEQYKKSRQRRQMYQLLLCAAHNQPYPH